MKIEVSNGEAIDKLSILKIKLDNIEEEQKKINIIKEHNYLEECCKNILQSKSINKLYEQLISINQILWKVEDAIRIKEKEKSFDKNFIELARKVYITNDERARIKKEINILTLSNFVEEKSHDI